MVKRKDGGSFQKMSFLHFIPQIELLSLIQAFF